MIAGSNPAMRTMKYIQRIGNRSTSSRIINLLTFVGSVDSNWKFTNQNEIPAMSATIRHHVLLSLFLRLLVEQGFTLGEDELVYCPGKWATLP